MTEFEALKKRLKNSALDELQQESLINYFSPIYYVEFEIMLAGELFPRIERVGYYDKTHNRHKKEALEIFERTPDAKRVIEKCMYTGKERIIKERA